MKHIEEFGNILCSSGLCPGKRWQINGKLPLGFHHTCPTLQAVNVWCGGYSNVHQVIHMLPDILQPLCSLEEPCALIISWSLDMRVVSFLGENTVRAGVSSLWVFLICLPNHGSQVLCQWNPNESSLGHSITTWRTAALEQEMNLFH